MDNEVRSEQPLMEVDPSDALEIKREGMWIVDEGLARILRSNRLVKASMARHLAAIGISQDGIDRLIHYKEFEDGDE